MSAVRRTKVALVRAGEVADLGRGDEPTSCRNYVMPERAAELCSSSEVMADAPGG